MKRGGSSCQSAGPEGALANPTPSRSLELLAHNRGAPRGVAEREKQSRDIAMEGHVNVLAASFQLSPFSQAANYLPTSVLPTLPTLSKPLYSCVRQCTLASSVVLS